MIIIYLSQTILTHTSQKHYKQHSQKKYNTTQTTQHTTNSHTKYIYTHTQTHKHKHTQTTTKHKNNTTHNTQPHLNPDRVTYTPLGTLSTATEKARRDAPAIAVCEI